MRLVIFRVIYPIESYLPYRELPKKKENEKSVSYPILCEGLRDRARITEVCVVPYIVIPPITELIPIFQIVCRTRGSMARNFSCLKSNNHSISGNNDICSNQDDFFSIMLVNL